ncbi:DUF433 domain-containing protein [Spirosoma utsteinense]|uniref:DUF433 domain-containing protein n=1 Tax=Spirosoma utsteinense TaxID=2585773 RepID=A0ABR6WBG2_9BACT|nr:DUF433 domain-containing protein [Spirosoma utsteinense]MBC3787822.1 putative protein (DUF433 family) [Spirosoma utsteinense]MBC3793609.1 putative protein (DUF433 family) [Spirosoma utsteinense]
MNLVERITVVPDVCNGKPTIRGMRITVRTVLEYLAAGETAENILDAYPNLELADIQASLAYAALLADVRIDSLPLPMAA